MVRVSPWHEHFVLFLLLYAAAFLACWGAARCRPGFWSILGGALLFRALLVPLPPMLSGDIYRYVWEGRVQAAGANPYLLSPLAPELAPLRDHDWSQINHPEATAIYPPLAQLVCRGLAASGGGVTRFKAAFVAFDLGVVLLLGAMLRRRGAPLANLVLYAWNPLVVVEVAGSGHLEPLGLLPLLAALVWAHRRPAAAWGALAACIAVKYAGLLVAPLLARGHRSRVGPLLATALLLVVTLPFLSAGKALFASLGLYAAKWRFNDLLFAPIMGVVGSLFAAKALATLFLLAVLALLVWRRTALETAAQLVFCTGLLLSPTIHPWYLLWPVVLLPLVPLRPLFFWSGSIVFAYLFVLPLRGTEAFAASHWLPRCLEIVPPLLVLAFDLRRRLITTKRSPAPVTVKVSERESPALPSNAAKVANLSRVALVIPALDEEEALPKVLADLERLQRSHRLLDTIVVVDNGSTDGTASIVRRAGVTLLEEPRRGYGAACLRALAHLRQTPPDIVVFMDADCSDHPEDLPALLRPLLEGNYDLVIGSRVLGEREPGALLPQSRFGNWLATRLIRARFGFRYTDLGPFRAVRFRTLEAMRLADRDFGWTIEMQIRALQIGARVTEVPVRYRRRIGRSKISGTVTGSLRAGTKILATFWRLRRPLALALVVAGSLPGALRADGMRGSSPPNAVVPGPFGTAAENPALHFSHRTWNELLQRYVDSEGRVDYRDLQRIEYKTLAGYMQKLVVAQPDDWPRDEQIAFWANAYNAGIVWAVLQGESPEPLVGRAKIFKLWKFTVAGKERTLDEIEHEILRQRFQEPRIHFALVCASTSCPKLRREAYGADSLQAQLEAQARDFLNDRQRNQFLPAEGKMRLSKIFDWFRGDFEKNAPLRRTLAPFVADEATRRWLLSDAPIAIEFLDYDWTLNAQAQGRPASKED